MITGLGISNVEVRTGDGAAGAPDRAPFHGVVVTAMADGAPPPALLSQLTIGGIHGDKDVELSAGQIDLSTDPAEYRHIALSVYTGELTVGSLGVDKGGLGREGGGARGGDGHGVADRDTGEGARPMWVCDADSPGLTGLRFANALNVAAAVDAVVG